MSGELRRVVFDALLALALAVAVWAYRGKAEEAEDLRAALDASCERVEQLRDDLRLQAETLSERDAKISRLASDKARLNKKLTELIREDEDVKAWSTARVPAAVGGLLAGGGATGDTGSAPDAARSADVAR